MRTLTSSFALRLTGWVCVLLVSVLASRAATVTVEIFNNFFSPETVTVDQGDTVTWIQRGFNHNTESFDFNPATGQRYWQSAILTLGQTFSFTFNVPPATYRYRCFPHRTFMFGNVIVNRPPQNTPPTVTITAPADGAIFSPGSSIAITADAADSDGVAQVEFFANGTSIGIDTAFPFSAVLNNAAPGSYTLTARATDTRGAAATSTPTTITVNAPANGGPIVNITNPPEGATFSPGTNITINAEASDPDGVAQVEFFANGASIGSDGAAPYAVSFNNVAPGNYVLTAQATDTLGARSTSAVVNIVVSAPPPPGAPVITSPPQDQVAAAGSTVTFRVTASGDPPLVYQWFFNGSALTAQTNDTLVLSGVQPGDAGNYPIRVSNPGGSVQASATLTVNSQPPVPTVALVSPTNGASFAVNSSVLLRAVVSPEALVTKVEFFAVHYVLAGSPDTGAIFPVIEKLGEDFQFPFEFTWPPSATNRYELFAVVTDIAGQTNTSANVAVSIVADSQRPVLSLTLSPPNFSRLRMPTVTLAGRANDENLAGVEYSLNEGFFQPVNGLEVWTAEISLVPGTNVVVIRASDSAGNFSDIVRTFFYVVPSPLTVVVDGEGTVSPNLSGRQLEIGRTYRLVAVPRAGNIFAGWDGAGEEAGKPALRFQMQSNLVLTVHFIPNPFGPVAGTYNGLLFNSANIVPEDSGFLRASVSRSGSFSGFLIVGRRGYPFAGRLDYRGEATIPVLRRPLRPVVLHFTANLTNGAGQINGTATDGIWTTPFTIEKRASLARTKQILSNPFLAFRRVDSITNSTEVKLVAVESSGALIFQLLSAPSRFSIPAFASAAGAVPLYFPNVPGQLPVMGFAQLVYVYSGQSGGEIVLPPGPVVSP